MVMAHMGLRTMEMVAVALSEAYGVRVIAKGLRAHTTRSPDGKKTVIAIPAIETDDENYLTLLRGYIDHEVGHVRFTNQKELSEALETDLAAIGALKMICHIYEDVYVERLMGECFPGCRRNIRKLALLVFGKQRSVPVSAAEVWEKARQGAKESAEMPYHIWTAISQYILYRVRREAIAELGELLPEYRAPVDVLAPGLVARLEPVLARIAPEGIHTRANTTLAKETLKIINEYFDNDMEWQDPEQGPCPTQVQIPPSLMSRMQWVLRFGGSTGDSVDIGRAASAIVDNYIQTTEIVTGRTTIQQRAYGGADWKGRLRRLSPEEQLEALQASAMLDAQVQSLLQTYVMNRAGSARTGKLNTNVLHRLSTGNSNIFTKRVEKRGMNTEIVVAIDMSGSMEKSDKALMASKALYAVLYSLRKIPGIRSSIIGFYDDCVLEILRPSDRMTPRMKIVADGGTLCGEALKYAMQTFTNSPDSRKVVFMLTDGDSDNGAYFGEIIARTKRAGIEFLGIGIMDDHITRYLQEEECCVLTDLHQLASEMFRMLRKKLLKGL